jgi:hypothetical protein
MSLVQSRKAFVTVKKVEEPLWIEVDTISSLATARLRIEGTT